MCRLKVSIKTTSRNTTPVLKRIELFGRPHFITNSKQVQRDIWKRWNDRKSENEHKESSKMSAKTSSTKIIAAGLTIPDEFQDAITCEIMSMPMILPSGKVIDRSSLERHSRVEETWGRSPSDPYTGVVFTAERKPILNAALKVQIDRFLLANAHCDETRQIPRTVGTVVKRKRSETYGVSEINVKRMGIIDPSSTSTAVTNSDEVIEDSAVNRINKAVEMALLNITRFSKQTAVVVCENKCFKCVDVTEGLYQIRGCSHFVCRRCILLTSVGDSSQSLMQCSCGFEFTRSDLDRFYHKTIA